MPFGIPGAARGALARRLPGRYAAMAGSGRAGSFLAPVTPFDIRTRNPPFGRRLLLGSRLKAGDGFAAGIDLKACRPGPRRP